MITTTRKSKYKYKITMPSNWDNGHEEMVDWCTQSFGYGGRHKKFRWRFGWTGNENTFYFKKGADATMFVLRWADEK